ncbi:MAG: class C sortase [Lachnospiraceae bacterium]|nr:class C sortase [Lachnospiraceae bacterium]
MTCEHVVEEVIENGTDEKNEKGQKGAEVIRAQEKKRRPKRRDRLWNVILVLMLIAGLVIALYPTVSNWWNTRLQQRVIASYTTAVQELAGEDYSEYVGEAQAYNEAVAAIGSAKSLTSPQLAGDEYWDLLDITGTGVMGYVTIEKISVQIPIYHGTDSEVLKKGAGHLQGSSLPIGGESTHAVILAHRGLPGSSLFTDLDKLEVGDTFTVTVLDQVLTYEIDQIVTVLPDELEELYIEEGKDYCTLMTCTPYGINSHRLLVRGVRVENAGDSGLQADAETDQTNQSDYPFAASLIALLLLPILLILAILLIRLFAVARRKKKQEARDQ